MSVDAHANFAYATVDTAPTPDTTGTSLTVAVGLGALFPAAPFNAVVYPNGAAPLASNAEIVRVTAVVGDAFTIVRMQEGTSARAILSGDQIAAAITVKTLTDVEGEISGKLSAINVSAGTTSNNLSALTFSDGNGISFGLDGSTLTATVATNYQSQGAYLTTAALSQDSSRYAGTNGAITGGSITVNTSGVSVDLPAYLTTALGSDASTQFVQAAAVFHGTNISGTIASNDLSLSVAPAAGSVNISAGTTSNLTTAIRFRDSNGVSFGLDAGTITATVKTDYLTTAMASNRGSDFVQATAVFNGTNASGTIASGAISVSVAAPGITNINVSAGTTSNNLTALTFSDANGVSFGINASTITATVKTDYLTTAALSGDTSKYVQAWQLTGNTSGTTSSLQGTKLHFSGGNSITVSGSSNSIVFSVGNYLTTAALSQDSSKYAGTGFTSAGANIGLSGTHNTAGLSLSATVAAQTNQSAIKAFGVSNTGQTAGNTGVSTGIDWVLAGSQSITLSQSTAVGGPNTVWIQHPAWLTTAALSGDTSKYMQAWELTGNTAGTTSSLQGTKIYFEGGNSITVSGTSNTIKLSVGNYLTTARASNDAIGLNTAKTNVTWTVNSSGLSFDAGGYAGTGFTSAGTNISISGTNNTAGLSLSLSVAPPGAAVEANWVTLTGNVVGNSSASGTTIAWSGGNGVTLSGTNNSVVGISVSTYSTVGTATTAYDVASVNSKGTVTRWAAEDHSHAGIGAIGISTGNTLGTSGSKQGTYWVAGSGGLTVSQITSNNGSHTLVLSDNPVGFNGYLEPYPLQTATQTLAPTAGSFYLAPFTAFGSLSGGRVNFLAVNTGTANLFQDIGETAYKSNTTGTLNQSYTFSGVLALFSQGTGANSTRLESIWSNSHSWGWSKVINVSTNAATNIAVSLAHSISYISEIGSNGAYTNVQYANAGSSTINNSSGNSTLLSTVFSSGRNLISGSLVQPYGFSTTLTAGIYWVGYAWSSTRATASTGGQLGSAPDFNFSGLLGLSRLAIDSLYRNFGSTATTARSQLIPYGVYTGAANLAPPTNIALSSDLSSLASQWVPYFNWNNRGLTK